MWTTLHLTLATTSSGSSPWTGGALNTGRAQCQPTMTVQKNQPLSSVGLSLGLQRNYISTYLGMYQATWLIALAMPAERWYNVINLQNSTTSTNNYWVFGRRLPQHTYTSQRGLWSKIILRQIKLWPSCSWVQQWRSTFAFLGKDSNKQPVRHVMYLHGSNLRFISCLWRKNLRQIPNTFISQLTIFWLPVRLRA